MTFCGILTKQPEGERGRSSTWCCWSKCGAPHVDAVMSSYRPYSPNSTFRIFPDTRISHSEGIRLLRHFPNAFPPIPTVVPTSHLRISHRTIPDQLEWPFMTPVDSSTQVICLTRAGSSWLPRCFLTIPTWLIFTILSLVLIFPLSIVSFVSDMTLVYIVESGPPPKRSRLLYINPPLLYQKHKQQDYPVPLSSSKSPLSLAHRLNHRLFIISVTLFIISLDLQALHACPDGSWFIFVSDLCRTSANLFRTYTGILVVCVSGGFTLSHISD